MQNANHLDAISMDAKVDDIRKSPWLGPPNLSKTNGELFRRLSNPLENVGNGCHEIVT
jgi:hypothetical protein